MLLALSKENIEYLRRTNFVEFQKIRLELERHKAPNPGEMEDKDYTTMLANRLNNNWEILEACNNALSAKQLPEKS